MATPTRQIRRHRAGTSWPRARSGPALVVTVILALGIALPVPAIGQHAARAEDGAVSFRSGAFSDVAGPQAYYFNVVATAGIVRGDAGLGGPCRPADPITRAEFAVMVMRLMAVDPAFVSPVDPGLPFEDAAGIPSWAEQAVAACASLGIVNGVPDGLGGSNFNPSGDVSGAEAVAMLLRALRNSESITGGWPNGYLFRAFETGLFSSDLSTGDWRFVQPLSPLTRAQMAYLVGNALFCSRGYRPGLPGHEGLFTLPSLGGGRSGYALVVDADLSARTLATADGRTLSLAGTVVAPGVLGVADLVGRRVFWLQNSKGQIAFLRRYGQEAALTGELGVLVLGDNGTTVETVVLADGRRVTCGPEVVVELNGQRWPFDPATILPRAAVTAIMDGGRAAYVSIIHEDLPEAVIQTILFDRPPGDATADRPTTGRITARISMGEGDIPLIVTPDTAIYLDGQPADLSDLREWDVFYAATGGATPKTALRLYAYRNRLTGVVTGVSRLYDLTGFHWRLNVEDAPGETAVLGFGAFCQDLASTDLTGQELTFCLNRLGEITYFRRPGPGPGRPRVVKVMRVTEVRTRRLLTVDWQGAQLTYILPDASAAPPADALVRIWVDAGGSITRTDPTAPAFFEATVVAYDEETDRLSLSRDPLAWTLTVRYVPVYEIAGTKPQPSSGVPLPIIGAAVPVETLIPGQTIWLDDPGAPSYMLVLPR